MQGSLEAAPIDRYVVLEYLSEGGMGAIYLGKKLGAGGFEKEVVLKQLLPEFTQQPEFIDLFLREARLSATLDHANIIHTIDLVTAGAEYFIVMEYLAGADLRTLLKKAKRRRGKFSAAAGIYIAREVLSALAYAHVKNGPDGTPLRLIHRDVSPSNVLVSLNGEVKLTDFGIAKASTHNSVFYRVKGKVGYMSPEQARSETLDHRSDLYSLAVCLYEIITGERLFVHAGLTSTPDEIYGQPIPLLSRKIPGLPAELDKVMLRALSIDPDARYQTAGELQEALLRCAHRAGLMMSAPDLANHLRQVCGPAERWRDLGDGREVSGTAAFGGGGTEVLDAGADSTEQLDAAGLDDDDELLDDELDDDDDAYHGGGSYDDDDDDDMPLAAPQSLAAVMAARRGRGDREQTSITQLGRLQGLELTSLINMADTEGGDAGAEPLVDLDAMDPRPPVDGAREPTGAVATLPEPPRADPTDQPAPAEPAREARGRPAKPSRPPPVAAPPRERVAVRTKRSRAWLVVVLIILAAGGVAAVIGMSGPTVETAPRARPAPVGTTGDTPTPR